MQRTALITLVILSFMACQPVSPELSGQELSLQEFTASLDPGTKTTLSGTHVLWDASGEAIDIVNSNGSIYTAAQTGVSSDRRKATFAAEVPESGNEYAVYPSGFCTDYDDGMMTVRLPSVQTAVADGFSTRTSPAIARIADGGAFFMRNLCSMIGIKVSNSGIASVSIAATEADGGAITGTGYVDWDGELPECISDATVGSGHVELNGGLQAGTQYWALVYPGSYTGLKVVFTSTAGRTATFNLDGTFLAERSKGRRISEFTIGETDWDDYVQPGDDGSFTLVTDESSLKVGDEVLIVYTAGSKALGPVNSSGNFRDPVDISISGSTISSPGSATVLTLEAGTSSGTWAFRDGSNYLASVASNKYLKNSSTKTANASWSITIASSGLATVKAQAGECVYLTYNVSSPRFSCYANTNQKAVSIYRRSASSGGNTNPGTPAVTTQSATSVGMAEAVLNASFSGMPLNPDPTAAFFRWGTAASALTNEAYDNSTLLNTGSGTFSTEITGLQENTTYYYKAVITLADGSDVSGSVMSFTTRSAQQSNDPGYLSCYEIPAVDASGRVATGDEKFGYKWFKYYTNDSNRAVATHTFKYNNKVLRNYTVMLDASKKSPVWCATAFNTGTWPDKNIGRKGSWTSDPAFPADWQQENATGSYSKGHFIASNYRQTTLDQDKQTFYLSNQAAQWQTSFNDGIWNQLENQVVASAPSGTDTLYVVVGILFEGSTKIQSGIYIPSHFYKCIMKCSFNSEGSMTAATGCAYIFENKAYSGSYNSYKTTIDAIEQRAGLDFFHNVPDDLEDAAERVAGSPI
ncbi:MAG: DNA/RNA non-specific endonuclease [Bacteroidales bacterium]|nr:DNA/RNA non-specific endonuclease [Bacteroidales bacterium]